jgi:hypothetical protein
MAYYAQPVHSRPLIAKFYGYATVISMDIGKGYQVFCFPLQQGS